MAWIRGKLLGAGAFGSVNLAINREDGEVFAVKSVVVNDGSEVAVRAIENEISLLQELESRYVVRCLGSDWTEEGGELRRNVFLEYMPEGCLTDFVKQFASSGSLDEHLLRTYTRSIVEGIDYLHSRGIVHCDVKGKNVLVGNGSVKLTDFGSAKRGGKDMATGLSESEVVNSAAKVNGTPLWMAPEVVRQVEQGPASDIWSLGCTVVEMATGRAPWSNLSGMNHFVALYHIGCTDELPAVPASLSPDAHDFLSHCFQRDPRRRWTSAQLLQHPFLTTRFVPAPVLSPKPPASPISVLQFHDSDNSDGLSASFVNNSVPTLAAPSLFKRGLVSAKLQEHVEENSWWSTSASTPDSGPWIVVRSPTSSPPSFALSDWTTTPVSVPDSYVAVPIVVDQRALPEVTNREISVEQSIPAVAVTIATPFLNISSSFVEPPAVAVDVVAVVGTSATSLSPLIQTATTSFDCRHFAISEMDPSARSHRKQSNYAGFFGSEKLQFFVEDEDGASNRGWNLGFAVFINTVTQYSERVYQYFNPQILLFRWHSHSRRLQSSCRSGSMKMWPFGPMYHTLSESMYIDTWKNCLFFSLLHLCGVAFHVLHLFELDFQSRTLSCEKLEVSRSVFTNMHLVLFEICC